MITRLSKPTTVLLITIILIGAIDAIDALVSGSAIQAGNKPGLFQRIEKRLNTSPQVAISFKHIVVSDFFDTADTLDGQVIFTQDGRYSTDLGTDHYLFDGDCLWEYSRAYAQATKNCLKDGQRIDDSFLFFRNFELYYHVKEMAPDSVYQLWIRKDHQGEAPDSLIVTVSKQTEHLLSLEYFDINEELNRLIIGSERHFQSIDSTIFHPEFPDSVEIIEIPG